MTLTVLLVGTIAFVVGVIVGIVWTNISIANYIGRKFGW